MRKRYTVDIDVGGTMTDGLFGDGLTATPAKVNTTPHDLTVCLLDCLREGASRSGFADLAGFLAEVEVIRWSSTIATNVLAERKGPKLGLLVARASQGSPDFLYGERRSPAAGHLVHPEAIVEISQPVVPEEIAATVKQLLERGVRRICVSLKGAFQDPKDELAIKRIVEEQYPDHTLGAVPVLLGSDIAQHPDDMTRTHLALMNAYVHGPLASSLFKAEEELLLQHGYRRPLLIGHVNGGVARVAKTKAVDTIEAGPVFGLLGAAHFARTYRLPNVISLDVGGTTVKIGVIVQGEALRTREPEAFGIPWKVPMALLHSVPLGGGSVVHADPSGKLRFGPESMGAYPGPACYDLGGTEATLTDALVVLGRINPESFLGGARWLNADTARAVIREKVAEPLGVTVEVAALRVFEEGCRLVSREIKAVLAENGRSPEDFTLFAFGGNGPLFACQVAEALPARQGYVFGLGAVFSAFGSSISPVSHTYEYALFEPLVAASLERLVGVLPRMVADGLRDMRAEGFRREDVQLAIELEVGDGKRPPRTFRAPVDLLNERVGTEVLQQLYSSAVGESGATAGLLVERLLLRTTCPVATYRPPARESAARDVAAAPRAERPVIWNGAGPLATEIHEQQALGCGLAVVGPAIVEGGLATHAVPPGWRLAVDPYLNGRMTRA